jgi:hypothetical protein
MSYSAAVRVPAQLRALMSAVPLEGEQPQGGRRCCRCSWARVRRCCRLAPGVRAGRAGALPAHRQACRAWCRAPASSLAA